MDPNLILRVPPPLDQAWLEHEKATNLLAALPIITDSKERQELYSKRCKDLNAQLLACGDRHLTKGIKIHDTSIEVRTTFPTHYIPVRSYNLISAPAEPAPGAPDVRCTPSEEPLPPIVIYYHGGGLYVGDLDGEDLTCRRICKALQCSVFRRLPSHA